MKAIHGDKLVRPGDADFAVNVVAGPPPQWLTDAVQEAWNTSARTRTRPRRGARSRPSTSPARAGAGAQRRRRGVLVARRRLPPDHAQRDHHARVRGARRGPQGQRARPARLQRTPPFGLPPVPDDIELLFVTNPCNPTGTLHTQPAITASSAPAARCWWTRASWTSSRPATVRRRAARHRGPQEPDEDDSIAGLRAGYLIADPELVARLDARRQAWPVNGLALAAMTAWARQPPDDALIDRIAQQRTRLAAALTTAGVHVYPGAANFLLAKVPAGTVERLRTLGIAVRPTEDLGLDAEHIRIAVREDAERLIAAL